MSEQSRSVAIGAFIVGAALIAVAAILFVTGSGFSNREKIVMVFDGSVKGLNIGAPVALRGVQVGQVTDINVILDADNLELIMVVETEFREDRIKRVGQTTRDVTEELIDRGLRAQLNTQSLLTGLLYIQMDFYPDTEVVLRDIDSPYFQFPTIPTDMERITRKLQDLDFAKFTENMEAVVSGLNQMVNSDHFRQLPADVNRTLASLTALSDQLQDQLAKSMPKVDKVLDEAAVAAVKANEVLPNLSQQLEDNLIVLGRAVEAFEQTMNDVEGIVAPDSPTTYQLNQALREITLAGRALQMLAKTLEEQPEALIRGRSGDE
jgi:paraquat-inducible protein B